MIIAIDGPAGSGKSTVAKALAARLGYRYLDTGAMYRAFTWKAIQSKLNSRDADFEEKLRRLAESTQIELRCEEDSTRIVVDGEDVTKEIRTSLVDRNVSEISSFECVRERMVDLQRRTGASGSIVAEGRDMGTVVFPDADKKFYLDAAPEIRGKRRYLELSQKGACEDADVVLEDILKRDEIDSSREIAPLKRAEDAIYIDTSDMSINEVVELLMKEIDPETMV